MVAAVRSNAAAIVAHALAHGLGAVPPVSGRSSGPGAGGSGVAWITPMLATATVAGSWPMLPQAARPDSVWRMLLVRMVMLPSAVDLLITATSEMSARNMAGIGMQARMGSSRLYAVTGASPVRWTPFTV